jgi:HSP20 family molecular chaperone IbpA
VIRDVGEAVGERAVEAVGRAMGRAQESRELPVDLLASESAYLAVFDAPGAECNDVQARYEDGAVLVRVDRFREHREGFEMRFPGRGLALDGRVELPTDADLDPEGATATLRENGTLYIRVPKAENADASYGRE